MQIAYGGSSQETEGKSFAPSLFRGFFFALFFDSALTNCAIESTLREEQSTGMEHEVTEFLSNMEDMVLLADEGVKEC